MDFNLSIVEFSGVNEESIRSIRTKVFAEEQEVDPAIDFDGQDSVACHVLVSLDNNLCGTGRMLKDGHIGRIAVLADFRGKGLGKDIVNSLVEVAKKNNYPRVYLGAQKHAVPFYEKLGFSPYGEKYVEANIEHIHMEKLINC